MGRRLRAHDSGVRRADSHVAVVVIGRPPFLINRYGSLTGGQVSLPRAIALADLARFGVSTYRSVNLGLFQNLDKSGTIFPIG